MADIANNALTTNFNVSPYYDDYNEAKEFYRILFKPGYAVQARELTQMQTMFQKQVSRFGTHMFQEGSAVLGGDFHIDTRVPFVRVKDTDLDSVNINIEDYSGKVLVGQSSNIKAFVEQVITGTENSSNNKTLYIRYLSGSDDANTSVYTNNEVLVSNTGNTLIVTNTSVTGANPTGYGSLFTIESGVRYAKEHFVYFPKQTVVIDRYGVSPTCKVGFKVSESIITADVDGTLLDPAKESSNFSAPGADRFRIAPELITLGIDDINTANSVDYIDLFTIREGIVQEVNLRPAYNIIRDEIAKRTADESGDYYVRGLDISIRENKLIANNHGMSATGSSNVLTVGVGAGTAYVKGYEVNSLVTKYVNIDKANTTVLINNEIAGSRLGYYTLVNECVGNWVQDKALQVDLYNTAMKRITNKLFSSGAQTGTKIGTAKLKSFEIDNGTPGTFNCQYKAYLFDIQMNPGYVFADVKSIYRSGATDGTASIGADTVLDTTNKSDGDFLDNLYELAFGYPGDEGGIAYWKDLLATGKIDRRGVVATFFSTSTYGLMYPGAAAFVTSLYNKLLNRQPDDGGKNYWTNIYNSSSGSDAVRSSIVNEFLGSKEFNTPPNINLLFGGVSRLYNSTSPVMIYKMGSNSVQTLKSTGVTDTSFTFKRTTSKGSVSATGSFTLGISTNSPVEKFTYGTVDTLSADQRKQIVVTCEESFDVAIPSTYRVTTTLNSTTVTSNEPTGFTGGFTNFNVGDKISIAGISGSHTITAIISATNITVANPIVTAVSNATFSKRFEAGDIIDLNGKGTTNLSSPGTPRTVTNVTPTSIVVNLNENFGSARNMSFSYRIYRSLADEVKKLLKPNAYVKISCATDQKGPYTLGFADVYKIKAIYKQTGSTYPSQNQDGTINGTDVTDQFTFDNGQRDDFYDHASITLKPGYSLASTDRLLIKFDYFEPSFTSGFGFFTIDSYPIDDSVTTDVTIQTAEIPIYKSVSTGQYYDLRNCLDFRSIKQPAPTASYKTTVALAPEVTAPATPVDFYVDASGLRIPANDSEIIYDYTYYLGRIDQVAMDKDGNIVIIKGNPSITPVTPLVPDNYMNVGTIIVAPYPSLAPAYASQLSRVDLSCSSKKVANLRYTMRDIGVLDNRIKNLEYYSALNMLEKSTFDLKILDANNIDRFKNGTFVDPFNDESLSAKNDSPDHYIALDPVEKSIRPVYEAETLQYKYVNGNNISYKQPVDGNIITLPYTEESFINQPCATTYRNVETSIYKFAGSIYLYPDSDNWVDTKWTDALRLYQDLSIGIDPAKLGQILSTTWNAWETTWSGYHGYDTQYQQQGNWLVPVRVVDYGLSTTQPVLTATGSVDQVTNFRRTGNQVVTAIGEETQSYGNRVVDVGLNLYIRPQHIIAYGQGLKPKTKYYVFFDNENMSNYCIPVVPPAIGSSIPSLDSLTYIEGRTSEGSALISDDEGKVCAVLRIPEEKHFRVGTKQVIITDSPTNEDDATSLGEAFFVAEGLTQTKQETIMTTKKVIAKNVPLEEKKVVEKTIQTPPNIWNPPPPPPLWLIRRMLGGSCLAYTFMPRTPTDSEGLFISSFDVYFAQKDDTYGAWFEIRAMDSAGGITRTQVPGTEVHLTPSQINISDDGSIATRITFPAPVFLYNNVEYALIVHTENANPNTYVFVSILGDKDLISGQSVTSRAYTGNLYTTNNNLDWNKVDRADLKVNFNRAKFNTNVVGQAVFGNEPIEVLTNVTNMSAPFNPQKGELFSTNDKLTFTGVSGDALAVGDYILQDLSVNLGFGPWSVYWSKSNVTNANGKILAVNGSTYTVANTGFTAARPFTVRAANGTAKNTTGTIGSVTRGNAKLRDYNRSSTETDLIMYDSNGLVSTGDIIAAPISRATATINTIGKFKYSVIDFEPSYLNFNQTSTKFEMSHVSNTGSISGYTSITPNENQILFDEKVVLSRSTEIDTLSSANSNLVRVTLSSATDYLSPVIDLSKSYSIYVHNIVNSNTYNEYIDVGGNLIDKYVSKIITLAEGQDAEDLNAIITSFRPFGTEVKVWAKISNSNDFEPFNNKFWFELQIDDPNKRSSITNLNDFREYGFKVPSAHCDILKFVTLPAATAGFTITGGSSGIIGTITGVKNNVFVTDKTGFVPGETVTIKNQSGATLGTYVISNIGYTPALTGPLNNSITYKTITGEQFTGFKQFQIKIGLVSDNSAIVPRVADLRCIALQM